MFMSMNSLIQSFVGIVRKYTVTDMIGVSIWVRVVFRFGVRRWVKVMVMVGVKVRVMTIT